MDQGWTGLTLAIERAGGPFPLRAAPADRRSRTVWLGPLTHGWRTSRTSRHLIINGADTFGGQTMTVVRADWPNANPLSPQKPGPEAYAPPVRRKPDLPTSDADPVPLRQSEGAGQTDAPAAENLNSLIQRIAAASMDDIDSVNRELESIREVLRNEGERVRQEITGYVRLSQASMAAMTLISESVRQWKDRRP